MEYGHIAREWSNLEVKACNNAVSITHTTCWWQISNIVPSQLTINDGVFLGESSE